MVGTTVGSIFFNSNSSDVSFPAPTLGYTVKTSSFGTAINPSMGWFISDKTAVGVNLAINPSHSKTTYELSNTFQKDEVNSFDIGAGGFVRHYFTGASFIPFAQAGVNAGIRTSKTEGFFYGSTYKTTYEGKSSGGFFLNTPITVGATKMISSSIGLDIFAGYTFSYSNSSFKETTLRDDGNDGTIDVTLVSEPTYKNTGHGFVVGVGFQLFLH